MDNQSVGTKKIVFKNRAVAGKPLPPKRLSFATGLIQTEAVQPGDERDSDRSEELPGDRLFSSGEIFDQFYKPLSVLGGQRRLAELALEPLVVPEGEQFSREAINEAARQEIAEALATEVYHLTQIARETNLDVYLGVFNVRLGRLDSYEQREILNRANAYFTQRYYDDIRDRGERPEISHQIAKRIGPEAADRIRRIATGLDIEKVSSHLWRLCHGSQTNRTSLTAAILLDCSELQVRALRAEFVSVPYRNIAHQIQSALAECSKNDGALPVVHCVRVLRYLLLGRSQREVALIKVHFARAEGRDPRVSPDCLESVLKEKLPHSAYDGLRSLLVGWSAEGEAGEIHNLLYPEPTGALIDDHLTDPQGSYDRDLNDGVGPILRGFKKRRMWIGKSDITHRVQNIYELLEERVAALSPERFLQTNDALMARFGYRLDSRSFRSLGVFDARVIAGVLFDRMEFSYGFFEIIKPILWMAPKECIAVQRAYQVLYGVELQEAIEGRLRVLGDTTPVGIKEQWFDCYVHGHGRWPLAVDLLGLFRGERAAITAWDPDFLPSPEDEQVAVKIAEALDQQVPRGAVDGLILSLLETLTPETLGRVERSFFELTEPQIALPLALSEALSEEAFHRYQLLGFGITGEPIVEQIFCDPMTLETIRELPESVIRIIREQFHDRYHKQLDQFVIEHSYLPQDEDVAIGLLSVVYTPDAYIFRGLIQETPRETSAHVQKLREFWTRELVGRLGLERAIDMNFPRMRVLLKEAVARCAMKPAILAEAMLSFEGVDPVICDKILECLDAVDADCLLKLLRQNFAFQGIIEEAYSLLYPDAPLRASVKAMKLEQQVVNEILLHLDGYSAEALACEVNRLAHAYVGESLEAALTVVFLPDLNRAGPRWMPEDVNWQDEMRCQVELAFERRFGSTMSDACYRRGVTEAGMERLSPHLFGQEISETARSLNELIERGRRSEVPSEEALNNLAVLLHNRGVRYRDRVGQAYQAVWGRKALSSEGLGWELMTFLPDCASKHTLLSFFPSLSSSVEE